jgi:hypothetical protein
MLLLFLVTLAIVLFSLSFVYPDANTAKAQKQQQDQYQQQQQQQPLTRQGSPVAIIPGLTQNVLTVVSFLIGTSSFVLGFRIQNAARTTTTESTSPSTTTKPAIPSSIINKYFEILILALVIPSVIIIIYGILLIGSHLYPEDAPYLLLLFALFIPAGTVLFLVTKLRSKSLN